MRNYINEIDETFVKTFLNCYLEAVNGKRECKEESKCIITKKEDYWQVNTERGYTLKFYNFDTVYQNFTSNILNLNWRTALCKKFGIEYYKSLEQELVTRHIKKVNIQTEKLKKN